MNEPFVMFDTDDDTYLLPEPVVDPDGPRNSWWTYKRKEAKVYANEADFVDHNGSMHWPPQMLKVPVTVLDDLDAFAVVIAAHKAFCHD